MEEQMMYLTNYVSKVVANYVVVQSTSPESVLFYVALGNSDSFSLVFLVP